jgi:hypothetical protein
MERLGGWLGAGRREHIPSTPEVVEPARVAAE